MYRERNFSGDRAAPVKVGEELDVKIEGVGEKGDGITRKEGFVIFVPNTKKDDQVRIRITRVLRKVGFGEVVGGSAKPAKPASDEDAELSEAEEDIPEETEDSESGTEDETDSYEDSEDFGEDK